MSGLPPLTASYHPEYCYINLTGISMITIMTNEDGEYFAWGWRYVHVRGQNRSTCEEALKSLIDEVNKQENNREQTS